MYFYDSPIKSSIKGKIKTFVPSNPPIKQGQKVKK